MPHKIVYMLGLIFLTGLYGQSDKKTTDTLERQRVSLSDSVMIPSDSAKSNILGVWTHCASRVNGVAITANACKIIEFKRDNSAVITFPTQEKEVLHWTMANDLLLIDLTENKGDGHNSAFRDSIFEVHVEQDSISFHLELRAKNKDVIHYLGRQK
jgi:hypothetical protein